MKLLCVLVILAMVTMTTGYNFPMMRKRLVDMRSFSLYDFPDDFMAAQQESQNRQHYINPKITFVTSFYPSYDFGRRR